MKTLSFVEAASRSSQLDLQLSLPSVSRWLGDRLSPAQLCSQIARSPWTLLACKLTIGIVSAYDIFLTVKYVESLPSLELNPIGRWLMGLDSGPANGRMDQIACFIAAKFAGNFLTLASLEALCCWRRSIATLVASVLACFQLFLLYFLLFGG